MRDGSFILYCGDQKIPLVKASEQETKVLLKGGGADYYGVKWSRRAEYIANDDIGNYYYLDKSLGDQDINFRLFIGKQKKLTYFPLTHVADNSSTGVFTSEAGRLVINKSKHSAVWIEGEIRTELVELNLYMEAPMIYRELGVYEGQELGTACEPYWNME